MEISLELEGAGKGQGGGEGPGLGGGGGAVVGRAVLLPIEDGAEERGNLLHWAQGVLLKGRL